MTNQRSLQIIVCALALGLASDAVAETAAPATEADAAATEQEKERAKSLCEKGVMSAAECAKILSPTASATPDGPLCTFAKRILSDRPAEFAAFKGALSPNDMHQTSFIGTATPDEDMKCNLYVRRKSGSRVLSPTYSCTRHELTVEEADALYAKHKAELRTCFAAATISETPPKAGAPTVTWRWKAKAVEYAAELEATDSYAALANLINGTPMPEKKMSVSVTIFDLSPARPDAKMPVMR